MSPTSQPVFDPDRYQRYRREIDQTLVDRLYNLIPQDSLFYLFYPLVLLYVTQGTEEFTLTGAWSVVVYILICIRLVLYQEHRMGSKRFADYRGWARAFTFSSLVAGLLTGFSVIMLFDVATPGIFVFAVAFVVGLMSANLNLSSYWVPAQAAFAVPTTLLPGVRLLFESGWLPPLLGVLLMLFLILSLLLTRTLNQRIIAQIMLEIENRELVSTLTLERNRANRASGAKTRFLAAASHDLRQPIHAINLLLDSLKHVVDDAQRQRIIDKLETAIDALSDLLSSLLDISKLDAGAVKSHKQVVNLNNLIEPLLRQYAEEIKGKSLTLQTDDLDFRVRSDPALLGRIIANLLSNAIKFTEQGFIRVSAELIDDRVILKVTDSGSGIDPDNLERVFDEFFQEQNPQRDRSRGIGLGLSICRRISSLLGHQMHLEPGSAVGTVAVLNLGPLADATLATNEPASPAPELAPRSLEGLNVLVVEDDILVADALVELLDGWGCEIRAEIDASQALACIEENAFTADLVITDLRLPGEIDGLGLAQHIVDMKERRIGVVILTGETDPQHIAEVSASGIPLLFKPLKPARLRTVVERTLRSVRSND
ncbi:MAG: hybrid sensor histidine kinase/response regulator [marine bacterium B5-7]|nr:MAG: hybrid sensor histidine kinase/response regulator [marine bacterium B5-7]